ncbi:MAG: hypothetical protein WC365_09645 [Candidatus Babeliales bacterium]|jgi:hypothetical protein
MPISRTLNKIYANLFGYFWLPCPICEEMFGGHEFSSSILMKTETSGECVCKNCGGKAEELNRKRLADNSAVQYGSFKKGPELSFNKDTNLFTFKGIEITVDEAIFLRNEMPKILLKHAVAKPEDWHWIVGTCGEVPTEKNGTGGKQ